MFLLPIIAIMFGGPLASAIVQSAIEVGKEILAASGLSDGAQIASFCLLLVLGDFGLRCILYRHDGAQGV